MLLIGLVVQSILDQVWLALSASKGEAEQQK
jgi:hypothetical protein